MLHRMVLITLAISLAAGTLRAKDFGAASSTAFANSGMAAGGDKTDVLPANGGELGTAFNELRAAFKAADKTSAARLLDQTAWHPENKDRGWFSQFSEQLAEYSVAGGHRQGDHATLFVVTRQPYYAMMNATRVAGKWQFESPVPRGTGFGPTSRDCRLSPTRFPCGASSAPDALVSGIVQSHRIDPETKEPFHPVTLFDGIAVRMLDAETGKLKSLRIILSGTGINPQMVALSWEPDQVRDWLGYPVLTLDVSPDGKSAKCQYHDGISPEEFGLAEGLNIKTKALKRVRGRLKTDVKDVAKFDVMFDIGIASACVSDKYQCGD